MAGIAKQSTLPLYCVGLTSFYFVLIHSLPVELGLFVSLYHAGEVKISTSPQIASVFKVTHFMH